MKTEHGEIIIYQSDDGHASIEVHLEGETVWLTLNQMADLFDRNKSVISRHLRTIYSAGELRKDATVAKNATVQIEGGRKVTRNIEWYNLDAIISVGYRVNSKRGTLFRIWTTSVLKDHFIKGYTVNERRLAVKGLSEMEQAVRRNINRFPADLMFVLKDREVNFLMSQFVISNADKMELSSQWFLPSRVLGRRVKSTDG